MFLDRIEGGQQLALLLNQRTFLDPLILAIPRGGVVTGAVLADALGAELDVVLSRKLRMPSHPELAMGAISEAGQIYLMPGTATSWGITETEIKEECQLQQREIARRKQLFRAVRPQSRIVGRAVIVTDDGIATGSTMIAALQCVRLQQPREVIVAVPVASPDRLPEIRRWCDDIVCYSAPSDFHAVGQYYEDFQPVEDEDVVELLRLHQAKRQQVEHG